MQSKVSIIIPTYNFARYLPLTLGSIFSQTYKNYEVIVVDDGSTDNTKEVIQKYIKKLIYIRHSKNKGISAAMNTGIKKAKGEYLNISQSDDLMKPDFIEKQIKILKENPDIGLIYSPCLIINDKGKIVGKQNNKDITKKDHAYIHLIIRNYIHQIPTIMRMDLVRKSGNFDEKLSQFEDWELYLKIAQKSKIAYYPEYLTFHRVHKATLSSNAIKNLQKLGYERKIVLNRTIKNNIPNSIKPFISILFIDSLVDLNWMPKFLMKPVNFITFALGVVAGRIISIFF